MENIPIIPILILVAIVATELILNKIFAENQKYKIFKIVFFSLIAVAITSLALISGDKQQLNQAIMMDLIIAVSVFWNRKSTLFKKNDKLG